MKSPTRLVFSCLLALLLTGCDADSASYLIDGNRDHSLSVLRDKPWPWSDWEVSLVVTRLPECMRRHRLKNAPADGNFKLELYESLEGGFILHQGKRWYVTETGKCAFQAFKEPPPEPGLPLGTFDEKDGSLKFRAAVNKPGA
ncbi:hypothetical protein B9N43_09245 [Denitratisoma sp. DHT3]|uniref:hypothetical protein n=1 Tax=Denitratisoma sp. DHT3 TaxID=1981880 RepID=UPI0011986CB7|nr:hypothetical protein [Denitratisoma sp. DHT3]QDX81413.1 hypothetical protein B9N43_09245 [Denitratisoma sp. DHT3]